MELLSKSEGKNSPYLTLGKIVSPHSLQGALKVHSLSDLPERLLELEEVFLLTEPDAEQAQGPFVVEDAQHFKGKTFLIWLEGIEDRSAADRLAKLFIAVPAETAPELPEDTFYARDLIGFEVISSEGAVLGQISQLIQSHQDLLVVTTPEGTEHWVPFVKELVPEVDVANRRLTVAPIEGLLEL